MQTFCQVLIVLALIVGFFSMVQQDFSGREYKPPGGFPGFVITLVVSAIFWTVYYFAGVFSTLVP